VEVRRERQGKGPTAFFTKSCSRVGFNPGLSQPPSRGTLRGEGGKLGRGRNEPRQIVPKSIGSVSSLGRSSYKGGGGPSFVLNRDARNQPEKKARIKKGESWVTNNSRPERLFNLIAGPDLCPSSLRGPRTKADFTRRGGGGKTPTKKKKKKKTHGPLIWFDGSVSVVVWTRVGLVIKVRRGMQSR